MIFNDFLNNFTRTDSLTTWSLTGAKIMSGEFWFMGLYTQALRKMHAFASINLEEPWGALGKVEFQINDRQTDGLVELHLRN